MCTVYGGSVTIELHTIIVEDGLWNRLRSTSEFLARKEKDRVSHWWDRRIETFVKDYEVVLEAGPSASDHERLVRTMAAENRFARRMLSVTCLDWLSTKQPGARNLKSSYSGVGYVFGTFPRDLERSYRQADISARCFVARGPSVLNCITVIGIATEVYDPSGYSMDGVYLHMPEWTAADEKLAAEVRQRFRILQEPVLSHMSMDEFPAQRHRTKTSTERNRAKRERRKRRKS